MKLGPAALAVAAVCAITFTFEIAGSASKYPPGPPYRSCPDTLAIYSIEQADTTLAPCHPAVLDTVLGVRGVITGFDVRASAFAFYFQTAGGGVYTGVQAFTGATNYNGAVPGTPTGGNLAIGDLVAVYGTVQEFPASNGTTEIEGPDVNQSTNDILVRRLSTGNAVPMNIVDCDQLNWLPAFSQGEQFEGGLVRIRGPLKVGRTTGTGIQSSNYLLTTVSPSSDSVLIDNFTLSPTLGGAAPPVGTIVDSVQGLVNQATGAGINSYRIQLRNGNDVFLAVPPNLSDAYPVEDHQIRLVFDRNVDPTSATNEGNYSLGSAIDGSTIDLAVLETTPGNVVILTITSVLTDGDIETISVQGIGSAGCPSCVISPAQQRTFVNGVLSCVAVQAPDPDRLPLFDDRSRYAGAGALPGTKLTYRGTAVHQFGTLYYMVDESGATRGGVSVFGPTTQLVAGRRYRVTGQVQEFQGESEIVSTALITDEGVGSIPSHALRTIAVLRDTTTDAAGSPADPDGAFETGEDYECMLVRVQARVTENRLIGQSFFVAGPSPGYPDTILISNLNGALNTFTPPDSASVVTVTGLLHFSNGTFRICPRGASDVQELGYVVDPLFFQMDFFGYPIPKVADTDWGCFRFTAGPGPDSIERFLNVVVRRNSVSAQHWVVRNWMLPAQSELADSIDMERFFTLAGVRGGPGAIPSLEYAFEITDVPYFAPPAPAAFTAAPLLDRIFDSRGISPDTLAASNPDPGAPPDSEQQDGKNAEGKEKSPHQKMPQIEEQKNHCYPVSVTRSLRWLHDQGSIDLGATTDAQLIDALKTASGWTQDGVQGYDNALKAKLKVAKDKNLNMVTKFARRKGATDGLDKNYTAKDGPNDIGTAVYMGEPTYEFIKKELAAGEDVEIIVQWLKDNGDPTRVGHAMTVVNAREDPLTGRKTITVQQDPDQNKKGDKDVRTPTAYRDPNFPIEPSLTGLPVNRVEMVISESPKKKSSFNEGTVSWAGDASVKTIKHEHFDGERRYKFFWTTSRGEKGGTIPHPGYEAHLAIGGLNGMTTTFLVPDDKSITDWSMVITRDDNTTFTKGGVVKHNSPWAYHPLLDLDDIPFRVPELGAFGPDSVATIYTVATLPSYQIKNRFGPLGGAWSVGQTLAQLGLTVVNGRIPGVEGLYFATTEFLFDPDSETGYVPTDTTTWLNSASYPHPLAIQGQWSQGDPPLSVTPTPRPIPQRLSLANRPNPFTQSTEFSFGLPQGGRVRLAVYDVSGRLVRNVVSGSYPAGMHEAVWDGTDQRGARVRAGVYYGRLEAGGRSTTARVVLLASPR